MAETPEASEFTSIYERIQSIKKSQGLSCSEKPSHPVEKTNSPDLPPAPLMSFDPTGCEPMKIPFALPDYLQLIDWSGRVFNPDKRGVLDENIPPILKRIGIEPAQFIQCAGDFKHISSHSWFATINDKMLCPT